MVPDRVYRGQLLSWGYVFVFLTPRLYSCLANGSADEFQRGDQLFRMRAVKDPLQIGKSPMVSCGTHVPPIPCVMNEGLTARSWSRLSE